MKVNGQVEVFKVPLFCGLFKLPVKKQPLNTISYIYDLVSGRHHEKEERIIV